MNDLVRKASEIVRNEGKIEVLDELIIEFDERRKMFNFQGSQIFMRQILKRLRRKRKEILRESLKNE